MNFNWDNVKPACCAKWLVLPTVYSDTLSYGEQLDKFCYQLNQLIENNNILPDFIAEMIKEYINSGAIGEVVRDILADYILNVKYPPEGITPAVGDGSADDTAAIQGCIDYAAENGGVVYFPYGSYLTQPLTMKDGVSLFGFDRYSTKIVLKGGATKPLIGGTVADLSIANLTLDGNSGIQVNDVNVVTLMATNVLFTNLIIKDGYTLVNYVGAGGHFQISDVVFGNAVEKCLLTTGNAEVQCENVVFNQLSAVGGISVMDIGTDGGFFNVKSVATCNQCIVVGGNNNKISAIVENATTPFVDNGLQNNVEIFGVSNKEFFSGDTTMEVGGNYSKHVAGAYTKAVDGNANESIDGNLSSIVTGVTTETYNADKNVNGTNESKTLSGKKIVNAGSLEETITGKKVANAESLEETVTGKKSTNAGSLEETVTNKKVTSAGSLEENVSGDSIHRSNNRKYEDDTLFLSPKKPIRYNHKPAYKDENFDSIPFSTDDGTDYDVLVYKKHVSSGINTKIGYNGSIMTKIDLPYNYYYAQGGTYFDGFYYQAVIDGTETHQIIYKINEITGQYTYKEFTLLNHANGMTNDGEYIYVAAWGDNTESPYKIYKLDTDLNIVESYDIDITLINIAYDKVTGKMYGSTGIDIYEIVLENNVRYTLLFTISGYFSEYTKQGLCVHDGTIYYPCSAPECILKTDLRGSYYTVIILDTIVNNLFELGELEDLEWVDGRLYTFSYNRSNMSAVQNNPSLLLFGNIGLNNDTIFAGIDMRRDSIFCGNSISFKCIGSSSNPFDDTQQAVFSAKAMNKVYPICYTINVNDVDKTYNGFYVYGNCVKQIKPVSGKPKIKYLRGTNAIFYAYNFTVEGKITNAENVLLESSVVTLQDITLSSVNECADRSFIGANSSIVSLIGVLSDLQDSLYNLGKVTYSGLSGQYKCYPKTTAYIHTSGAPNSVLGVEVAKNISVTTSNTLVTWNRIMPNDVSLAKYIEFIFIINGRSYGVSGTCKIVVDDITITITFSGGRFTVSATNAITISSIIAVR